MEIVKPKALPWVDPFIKELEGIRNYWKSLQGNIFVPTRSSKQMRKLSEKEAERQEFQRRVGLPKALPWDPMPPKALPWVDKLPSLYFTSLEVIVIYFTSLEVIVISKVIGFAFEEAQRLLGLNLSESEDLGEPKQIPKALPWDGLNQFKEWMATRHYDVYVGSDLPKALPCMNKQRNYPRLCLGLAEALCNAEPTMTCGMANPSADPKRKKGGSLNDTY